jgi:hypothetical protein
LEIVWRQKTPINADEAENSVLDRSTENQFFFIFYGLDESWVFCIPSYEAAVATGFSMVFNFLRDHFYSICESKSNFLFLPLIVSILINKASNLCKNILRAISGRTFPDFKRRTVQSVQESPQ